MEFDLKIQSSLESSPPRGCQGNEGWDPWLLFISHSLWALHFRNPIEDLVSPSWSIWKNSYLFRDKAKIMIVFLATTLCWHVNKWRKRKNKANVLGKPSWCLHEFACFIICSRKQEISHLFRKFIKRWHLVVVPWLCTNNNRQTSSESDNLVNSHKSIGIQILTVHVPKNLTLLL